MTLPGLLDWSNLWHIVDQTPAMVWLTTPERHAIRVNVQIERFTGIRRNDRLCLDLAGLLHPDDLGATQSLIFQHAAQRQPISFEARLRCHDGSWRIIHSEAQPFFRGDGRYEGLIGVSSDITEQRRFEQEVSHLVTHDALTGHANRGFLVNLIDAALAKARLEGRKLAVLVFAIDRFQAINESLGHGAGDEVLAEIGRRLTGLRLPTEITGHLSGNRFLLIGDPGPDVQSAWRAADRLLGLCRLPFDLAGLPHQMAGSVGVAVFPEDADAAVELMRAAETALQLAKQQGGNHFAFFDPQHHGAARRRFDVELDLRRAMPRQELRLHFQPKVALPNYRLVGFEALVRWQHPERGLLAPGLFIGLAEEAGLIKPLTRWVFDAVGRQLRDWIEAGLDPVPVAVNVSPDEFLSGLIDEHIPAYAAYDLPPGLLELEITESTMIKDFDRVCAIAEQLRSQGIKTAMDDFGTGYSSLASLNRLPISTLKIDRAFTKDIDWDRASRGVASAIISMARELGLDVVAEGVETAAQLAVLRSLNCQFVQGYLTGRPMTGADAAELLRQPILLGTQPIFPDTLAPDTLANTGLTAL